MSTDYENLRLLILGNRNFYPLTDSFNERDFIQASSSYCSIAEDAAILRDFVISCHKEFNTLMPVLENIINSLNLTEQECIELVVADANLSYFGAEELAKETINQISSPSPEYLQFSKLITDSGQPVNINTSQERVVDIAVEIIRNLVKRGTKREHNENRGADILYAQTFLPLLKQLINMLITLRDDAVPRVLYGQSIPVKQGENAFLLRQTMQDLEKLQYAAEIRQSNHIIESIIHMNSTMMERIAKRKRLNIKVNRSGQIKFKIQNGGKNDTELSFIATLYRYHAHVALIPLSRYKGLSLRECIEILSLVFNAFLKYATTKKSDSNLGFFFNRQHLIDVLNQSTNHDKNIISQLISDFTCDLQAPYLWKKPFIVAGENLYCCLAPLVIPNFNLYIEQLVSSEVIAPGKYLSDYRRFLSEVLNDQENTFECITLVPGKRELEDKFATNLLLLLKDKAIILEILVFETPIEAHEHKDILDLFVKSTIALDGKLNDLKMDYATELQGRKLLPCLLSRYPLYAGLQINNISVLDYNLLYNYLFAGSAQKVSYYHDSPLTNKKIAERRYYNNEKEYCENLEEFMRKPIPVFSLFDHLDKKEMHVYEGTSLNLSFEYIDHIGERAVSKKQARVIEDLLNYEYFIEPNVDISNEIAETIKYELSDLFSRLSRANYVTADERAQLFAATFKSRNVGYAHLMHYLLTTFSSLKYKIQQDEKGFGGGDPKLDAAALLRRLGPHFTGKLKLLDFIMPDIFTDNEAKTLIDYSTIIFDELAYRQLEEDDLRTLSTSLLILQGYRTKYRTKEIFYKAASNFVDMLNNSGYFQKARDLAEDILQLSIKRMDHQHAWLILFNCYTFQNNMRDAAINGGLLLSSIKPLRALSYDLAINISLALMKFCRNFQYHEYAVYVYLELKRQKLRPYDNLRIASVYFNVLMMNGKWKELEELPLFVDENKELMSTLGEIGVAPMLGIFLNLKRLVETGITFSEIDIDGNINKLKSFMTSEGFKRLEAKIIGEHTNIKEQFIKALVRLGETRDIHDYVNETKQLSVQASNLIRFGIERNDVESILLTSRILSDQTLNFIAPTHINPEGDLSKTSDPKLEENLKNYLLVFMRKLKLQEGQLFLWLFNYEDQVAYIAVSHTGETIIKNLGRWLRPELTRWTTNITNFHFNADNKSFIDYDEPVQRNEHDRLLQQYLIYSLDISIPFNELLVSNSIELSSWPHNLLISQGNFISCEKPVTNIISPEYFIGRKQNRLPKEYKLEAWIPTEDGNMTINWGYKLLEGLLQKMNAKILITSIPDKPLSGDINIFMGHGAREFSGFKAVRTSEDKRSSILNPARVFGSGKLAILFICNAGSSKDDVYSQQVISFSNELLRLGYASVISSFWPYDVTMSDRWLEQFLMALNFGKTVSQAVFAANHSLSEYDQVRNNLFLAPQGMLSMHLFGDPNLKVEFDCVSTQ